LNSHTISKMRLAAFVLTTLIVSLPCFAAGLGSPDTSCDPTASVPAAAGCTWYNVYFSSADGSAQPGSSFFNYYVAATAPPWTVTTTVPEVFRMVDGGHQGDMFAVYDNGVLLGTTSASPVDMNHTCANDSTGPGTNPAACWNDPLMSKGTFAIAPGNHSFVIVWVQRVPGGDSALQWFEIGPATPTTVSFVGSMPHIATEENWTTSFTFVNKGATTPVNTTLLAYDNNGNPLLLPLIVPPATTAITTTSLNSTIAGDAALDIQSSGPANVPVLVGAAQLAANGPADGFAIFHRISDGQEAVVPLEMRNASSYLLPFDNTGGMQLGVAMENLSAQPANITVILRDDTGAQIGTGSVSLVGNAHTSFVMATQFPATANLRGTAEFDTPTGGRISLLGIRFPPTGGLTTIPVLANVGSTGGYFAHVASGNGWTTTFVLVNAGTSGAAVNLNFFDDNGNPLSLPISYPQIGPAISNATSVNTGMGVGSTLLIQSTGVDADPLLTGSAQLSVQGTVGGFVIFGYENGNEAVVPLQTGNAGGYIIAFDNTNSTGTGIAVSNNSQQQANVAAIFRDNTGAQIGSTMLQIPANGHKSIVLQSQFPVTANIQGTVEFDAPIGVQIGAVGIRTPLVAHTFTTLPALAK
jgi:hypothetical protein